MATEDKRPHGLEIPRMRGGLLHNHLVAEAGEAFRQVGFTTYAEHPLPLKDGQRDFVDLLAVCDGLRIACEVETTPRHAAGNAAKAAQLNLPLWIVVSSGRVRQAVTRRLWRAGLDPRKPRIRILTSPQLKKELRRCFPLFSPANRSAENRKTGPSKAADDQQHRGRLGDGGKPTDC